MPISLSVCKKNAS